MTSGMTYWDALAPGLVLAMACLAILPWVDKSRPAVRVSAIAVVLFATWQYLAWRIIYTLPPVTEPVNFGVGLAFLACEALSIVGTSASLIFMTRVSDRSGDVADNLPWLLGKTEKPLVDVLICTYNEGVEVLEPSIVGALALNYPNHRVWVCDDGRREWLRDMCARYGAGYIIRSDNKHAKAGNINAAFAYLNTLDRKPDFIAVLDADFVPLPQFVTRSLALMKDETVGIVQTPQHFFNPDPIQSNLSLTKVWPDEQRYFFDVAMASKDAWGGAFCCGTSSIIRAVALQQIGGVPTYAVTEDYLLTLEMKSRGYQTLYLNEQLSLGLAPEGLAEYCTQRSRWCMGFMQIMRSRLGPLRSGNGLGLVDRIMMCESFLYWVATHSFRLMGMLVPLLYLLFDIEAVRANVADAIFHMLPYFVAQMFILMWLTSSRVLPLIADLYQLLCAGDVLKGAASGLFASGPQKFKVTAKGGDRRSRHVHVGMLRMFSGLLALSLIGIGWAFLLNDARPLAEASVIAFAWCWYNIIVLILACYVCIEQPRMRDGERFNIAEPLVIEGGGSAHVYDSIELSISGASLSGASPMPAGGQVTLRLSGLPIPAVIVRVLANSFSVRFEHTFETRIAVVRHIYSGRFSPTIETISPSKVAKAAFNRALR